MEVYYLEQEVEITSDMLYENRLTNQAILVLFQDVAGNHAINLKIDYDHLIKQNMIWVVVRNRHEVLKQPKLHEKVIVSTWPHRTNRFEFDREYEIRALDGTIYVKGDSKWCILDMVSRRIVVTTSILMEGEFLDKHNFTTPLKQIPNHDFTNIPVSYKSVVTKNQIDKNNHLNNTEYASMIDKALEANNIDIDIKNFEINFVKETKLHEELDFKILFIDGVYYLEGSCNNEVRVKAMING